MKVDYIPLAQSSTGEPWPPESTDTSFRTYTTRRKVILGSALVITLLVFYFAVADWVEEYDDFDSSHETEHDYHAAYIPFEPPPPNASAAVIARLTPAQTLPDHCRDAYMSSGELCFDPYIRPMDVVWTWVNGSDPLLREAKLEAESRFSGDDPFRPKTSGRQERQYRYVAAVTEFAYAYEMI